MNAEILIKDEAVRFSRIVENLEREYNGAQEFKSELTTALFNYYENIDKLFFIYEVAKQIDIYYDKHLLRCQHKTEPEKCPINVYYFKCKFFTEQEIRALNPSFNYSILRPNINSDLLKQNLVELKEFPEAAKLFQSAMDKLNKSRFERNLLDDLRLSLEVLLKSVLNNNKNLENQLDSIGEYLKQSGTSKEVVNMFRTLTDYFGKYQNSYIKHNDNIKEQEVDLLVNLTSAFINFIIQNRLAYGK
ncbi:MAG: hypothetical protein PHD61_06455 [Bacteroidales bacterium]|nr:hypothetical protein [Lentimicrobiaceae bacterium]MDD5694930.1 hypothetical protein [Bacteroidales bacterium]